MSVYIERVCSKCGMTVKQSVSYHEEDGRIVMDLWRSNCPICKGFLKKPTVGEIRRAIILESEKA